MAEPPAAVTPRIQAGRFLMSCLLGAGLGVLYGFLRPLRQRRTTLPDLLFVAAGFYAWVYLGFAICQGDIRMGYTAGLFLGALVWEATFGKWLRPVFSWFWSGLGAIWRLLTLPVIKIFKKSGEFIKILFASWKKWGKIKWNKRSRLRRKSGGTHVRQEESLQLHQAGIPAKPTRD